MPMIELDVTQIPEYVPEDCPIDFIIVQSFTLIVSSFFLILFHDEDLYKINICMIKKLKNIVNIIYYL